MKSKLNITIVSMFVFVGVGLCHNSHANNASSQMYRFDNHVDEAAYIAYASENEPLTSNKLIFTHDHWAVTSPQPSFATPPPAGYGYKMELTDIPELFTEDIAKIHLRINMQDIGDIVFSWLTDSNNENENQYSISVTERNQWFDVVLLTNGLSHWPKSGTKINMFRLDSIGRTPFTIHSLYLEKYSDVLNESPYGISRFTRNQDGRPCIYLRAPGALEYTLPIEKGMNLSTGISVLNSRKPVTFKISLISNNIEKTVLNHTLVTSNLWENISINLDEFTGDIVRIKFEVSHGEPDAIVLLSSPMVYTATANHNTKIRRPNIIVYLIDALRADHLDVYGYGYKTAPTIKALSEQGIQFEHCLSPSTWSQPSLVALHTGLRPFTHRVSYDYSVLPDQYQTLSTHLSVDGYITASITENPFGPPHAFTDRGFDVVVESYKRLPQSTQEKHSLDLSLKTNSAIDDFVGTHKDKPFYMLVHTMEPHSPRISPTEFHLFGNNGVVSEYDAGILWADHNLNRLLTSLRNHNALNNTIIIISADHGEGLTRAEGGVGHRGAPHPSRVSIPLIVWGPSYLNESITIPGTVQLIDVSATILSLAGIDIPKTFEGIDLKPYLQGDTDYSILENRGIYVAGSVLETIGVAKNEWYFLMNKKDQRLFKKNIRGGFNELQHKDLKNRNAYFLELIHQFQEKTKMNLNANNQVYETDNLEIDETNLEQLEALGYLN